MYPGSGQKEKDTAVFTGKPRLYLNRNIPSSASARNILSSASAKQTDKIWDENERLEWIVINPNAGDVIQGSHGRRKIRWKIKGKGKRGGVRIIYFNIDEDRLILEYIYKKSDLENMKL